MEPANIRQDTSAIWKKLIKPTYRAHLFDEVSTPLTLCLLTVPFGTVRTSMRNDSYH